MCIRDRDEELALVTAEYGQDAQVQETMCSIREEHEMVSRSVAAQKFEDAAHHRDNYTRLMDALYELCSTIRQRGAS